MNLAYYVLAALIACGVSFGSGYGMGKTDTINAAKAKQLDNTEKQEKRTDITSTKYEQKREAQRVITRTITEQVDRIVDRPVYVNQCIDDDGLRIVNAAIAGKAASEPEAAVLTTATTDGGNGQGGAKVGD